MLRWGIKQLKHVNVLKNKQKDFCGYLVFVVVLDSLTENLGKNSGG